MKNMFLPIVLLLALTAVPALAGGGNDQGGNNNDQGGRVRGAPGPLVGAGLPVILIGGGIYWLVRRRKRKSTD
jgi:LPXTG-motif cell wall-anchored protein